jgi:hypothetical protein
MTGMERRWAAGSGTEIAAENAAERAVASLDCRRPQMVYSEAVP